MSEERPSKEVVLMAIAKVISLRGTCSRLKVGCVVAVGGRIVSTGYNGSAPGAPHCIDAGCETNDKGHCIRTTHAETNAIAWAARNGLKTLGGELYTTSAPCIICAKTIASAGIVRVHYQSEFRESMGLNYLRDNGIGVIKHSNEETQFIRFSLARDQGSELHSL